MRHSIIGILLIIVTHIFCGRIAIAEETRDPSQLFYKANILYEKREYQKAIDEYQKILDLGLENGRLYYNMGNAFFKTGRLGQAILYYEKAHRLMPQDGDLKSNLAYAKSLVGEAAPQIGIRKTIMDFLMLPFRDFNLNALSIASVLIFLLFAALAALAIINPPMRKRLALVLGAIGLMLLMSLAAFGVRFYNEEVLRQGVVVQKDSECKYEPIDQSTTYYTLPEGAVVTMLETRLGWSRVRRSDGKVGWLKKEAVSEV